MKCPICGISEIKDGEKACHKCKHDADHVREIAAPKKEKAE
jgi:hypothetical protein